MKRAAATIAALALALGLSGAALAQDAAPAKGEKAFKMLDANGDGKVTKEEFLAASQKRAEARYAKLDPAGKGYLTKEDFAQAREKAREKAKARKANAAETAPAAQ